MAKGQQSQSDKLLEQILEELRKGTEKRDQDDARTGLGGPATGASPTGAGPSGSPSGDGAGPNPAAQAAAQNRGRNFGGLPVINAALQAANELSSPYLTDQERLLNATQSVLGGLAGGLQSALNLGNNITGANIGRTVLERTRSRVSSFARNQLEAGVTPDEQDLFDVAQSFGGIEAQFAQLASGPIKRAVEGFGSSSDDSNVEAIRDLIKTIRELIGVISPVPGFFGPQPAQSTPYQFGGQ